MDEQTLLSIKEFAEFTGVNQSTLRYYDEIGLLPPTSRGKNNYRCYTPFQVITLNFISVLSELGVPLATIKDISDNRTPEGVLELLTKQEFELNAQLRKIQKASSIIHTFRDHIQVGLLANEEAITIQELPEDNFILGDENDFKDDEKFYQPFIKFCNDATKNRINLKFPIGGYHDNWDHFFGSPSKPSRFFSSDPYGNNKRQAGRYLVGYNRGYYGEFDDLPKRMKDYAEKNKLVFKGPVYKKFLFDEVSTSEKDNYLSQVAVQIK